MLTTMPHSLKASEHPIKSVTIFQSSTAEVTRTFTVRLQEGRNVLQITGLSSNIDTESPRIHGLGADARVLDISCTIQSFATYKETKNADKLKQVNVQRAALDLERNLARQEYDMLTEAGKTLPTGSTRDFDRFMDNIIWRKREAMKKFLDYNQKIVDVDEELHTLKNTHKGETAGRVVATVLAQSETEANVQLTYLVTGVQWQPHYDLHASAASGKPSEDVTLLYYANITQSTGEDWTHTSLTLNTANSQTLQSLSVPALDPLKVTSVLPIHPNATMYGTTMFGSHAAMQHESVAAQVAHDPSPQEDVDMVHLITETAAVPRTTVARTPLALAYHVDGPASVPSDGVAHKVTLAQLDFSANLRYVCVPSKAAAAFIEATIENTSEYELLAGPASVFMDNGFVTKTSLGLVGANESFNCVLGIDSALKVDCNRMSATSREPQRSFAEPSKTTTRTVVTTVRNGHSSDISALVVRDALPLGNESANIKVVLRKPDGLAEIKDGEEAAVDLGEGVQEAKVRWSKAEKGKGGEKDGMFEWVCGTVAGGKEVKFQAEWDIKMPAKVQWAEMSQPPPSNVPARFG